MSGFVTVIGSCCSCGKIMGFNPNTVPSYRVNGVREPLCEDCVQKINERRRANNLPVISYDKDAYTGCPEEEIRWDD